MNFDEKDFLQCLVTLNTLGSEMAHNMTLKYFDDYPLDVLVDGFNIPANFFRWKNVVDEQGNMGQIKTIYNKLKGDVVVKYGGADHTKNMSELYIVV